jgi:hypothetical protein
VPNSHSIMVVGARRPRVPAAVDASPPAGCRRVDCPSSPRGRAGRPWHVPAAPVAAAVERPGGLRRRLSWSSVRIGGRPSTALPVRALPDGRGGEGRASRPAGGLAWECGRRTFSVPTLTNSTATEVGEILLCALTIPPRVWYAGVECERSRTSFLLPARMAGRRAGPGASPPPQSRSRGPGLHPSRPLNGSSVSRSRAYRRHAADDFPRPTPVPQPIRFGGPGGEPVFVVLDVPAGYRLDAELAADVERACAYFGARGATVIVSEASDSTTPGGRESHRASTTTTDFDSEHRGCAIHSAS